LLSALCNLFSNKGCTQVVTNGGRGGG
jgi:hypothetical protein